MATAVIGIVLQGVLWPIIGSVRGKGILIMRLVYWPIITELITAPCRALLRSIPEEWADKSGLSFGMIPPVLAMAQIGRIFQYSVTASAVQSNRLSGMLSPLLVSWGFSLLDWLPLTM